MEILDLIIAIPLLYFLYKGAVNGIVKEILNIVGITLAVFLTFNYMDALSVFISPFLRKKLHPIFHLYRQQRCLLVH